jgi:hypothetical protein
LVSLVAESCYVHSSKKTHLISIHSFTHHHIASIMVRTALASPCSHDSSIAFDTSFLQQQRQRESSAGAFDHSKDCQVIVEIIVDQLRDKLCQLQDGHLPSRLKTAEEIYYAQKEPHRWPWERTLPLTPTPPDTPTNNNEEPTSSCSVHGRHQKEADAHFQLELASSRMPQTCSPNPPQPKHSLRSRQSTTKRVHGGIQKSVPTRKHGMVTRSWCRGRFSTSSKALAHRCGLRRCLD